MFHAELKPWNPGLALYAQQEYRRAAEVWLQGLDYSKGNLRLERAVHMAVRKENSSKC